jgi:NADH-quinone oxidoreductase subunit H
MIEFHPIAAFLQPPWPQLVAGLVILLVVPPLAVYFALVERKLAADMQADPGPLPESTDSLLTRIGDVAKRLLKSENIPANADRALLQTGPVLTFACALSALAAIAVGPSFQVAHDINIGLLFALAASSLGCFGIFLGGWARKDDNSIRDATHAAVRLLTFQIASALALISGVLLAGTLKIQAIVEAQQRDAAWFIFLAPVAFALYVVASLAGTNHHPVKPGEQELESSAGASDEPGFRWTLYLIAEYTNRIVFASIATTIFLGGWLRPFPSVHWLRWLDALPPLLLALAGAHWIYWAGKQTARARNQLMFSAGLTSTALAVLLALPLAFAHLRFLQAGLHGAFWFLAKVATCIYFSTAFRFALPQLRFDRSMRIAWEFLIPLTMVNLFAVAAALDLATEHHWNRWLAVSLTTAVTLSAAYLLGGWRRNRPGAAAASPTPAIAADTHAG